jgi:light-independent protochlorophyllide reductase subunit B
VHPLVMGLEEHLLTMFREDFEFNDTAGPSHLGASAASAATAMAEPASTEPQQIIWSGDAQAELTKIPFFVRGKARRNTEDFAAARGIALIQIETLYEARSHFAR